MPCWGRLVPLHQKFLERLASYLRRPPSLGSGLVSSHRPGHTATGQIHTRCLFSRWHSWDSQSTGGYRTGQNQVPWASSISWDSRSIWVGPENQPTLADPCLTPLDLGKTRSRWKTWSWRRWRMAGWLCWPSWVTLCKVSWPESDHTKTSWITWPILSTTISWPALNFIRAHSCLFGDRNRPPSEPLSSPLLLIVTIGVKSSFVILCKKISLSCFSCDNEAA